MQSNALRKEDIAVPILNQGQQTAADGFFEFLMSDQKELIISGAGGVGKTFLMGYLIDEIMPQYHKSCAMMGLKPEFDEVVMTATTNKAAEVLGLNTGRHADTIHSFLNLKVDDNYDTGRATLSRTGAWRVHERKVIFIDECSMIDSVLLRHIQEGTCKCKVVYVGDHSQLAPVMEPISPIYRKNLPFFELTQPMRNADQPALMDVCSQLRETVATGEFKPIPLVPGVIDLVDEAEMERLIDQAFQTQNREARILAYTNSRTIAYNEHIRSIRGFANEYQVGELLINNTAIKLGTTMLSVEDEVEIIRQDERPVPIFLGNYDGQVLNLEVRHADLSTRHGGVYRDVPLPVDREHCLALKKWFAQRKNWERYHFLKNTIPDLRPRDAATVHKAQGSTYDVVFVDMGDISRCTQPNTAARLLYVAFTRARSKVVLYGKLAQRYGGYA